MSKVRDFAEIISTGVASTDVSGLTTAITNEFTSIEHIASSHIKTTLLYPAISGNITNGTAHTGTYGDTVQTDGHKYYYTDIKGSKPIKDPRIGAHFGSQRHMFKSGQLLEQETATHGSNVYSIDGRENMRMATTQAIADLFLNNIQGVYLQLGFADSQFFEVTGYFNDINFLGFTYPAPSYGVKYSINGASYTTASNDFNTTVASPLTSRYVSSQSVLNLPVSATLGINTVKVSFGGSSYGIELITQDTTDTASKSKIQIPAQTVISFNKQHSISATAQHYDPFNGFTTGDLAAVQALGIDDTTSLGLSAWWYSNSSVYYRPYNGGRVVKWVDSSGTIKTSVNMMPFNATSIGNSNINKKENASATNNDASPSFIAGAVDNSLAEVAKTFNAWEFGNGGANGNASYKDATVITPSAATSPAYVMDDGLTSLSGYQLENFDTYMGQATANTYTYHTFIGTGLTLSGPDGTKKVICQNLPYGTHIVKRHTSGGGGTVKVDIDGVQVISTGTAQQGLVELTFHQPKMPPIPEDAVVIADYMLMADFVKQTDAEHGQISKGIRYCNGSRDHFYNGAANGTTVTNHASLGTFTGLTGGSSPSSPGGDGVWKLPFFGTTGLSLVERSNYAGHTVKLGGSATTKTALDNSVTDLGDMISMTETVTLGQTNIETTLGQGSFHCYGHFVATPIHTSSHYQTFETLYAHELVGGDRNMEQTNLVVTPDGKTWDEVTRDTSYMGTISLLGTTDTDHVWGTFVILDEWRGKRTIGTTTDGFQNKDFAIAYDSIICLVEGHYLFQLSARYLSGSDLMVYVNNDVITSTWTSGSDYGNNTQQVQVGLKRGDWIQLRGEFGHGGDTSDYFQISRIK